MGHIRRMGVILASKSHCHTHQPCHPVATQGMVHGLGVEHPSCPHGRHWNSTARQSTHPITSLPIASERWLSIAVSHSSRVLASSLNVVIGRRDTSRRLKYRWTVFIFGAGQDILEIRLGVKPFLRDLQIICQQATCGLHYLDRLLVTEAPFP